MAKKNAAAENTHTAADTAAELLNQAAGTAAVVLNEAKDRLGPLVEQGKERVTPYLAQSRERLTPYVEQGRERITPLVDQSRERLTPYVEQGRERIQPLAMDARAKGASYAHKSVDQLQPKVHEALDMVSPAVENLRKQLDLMVPKVNDYLTTLEQQAAAAQLETKGVQKAVAKMDKKAAKDAAKAAAKNNKSGKGLVWVVVIAALGGLGAFLWKKFMSSSDSDWQSHTPTAYGSKTETAETTTQTFTEPVTAPTGEGVEEATEAPLNEKAAADSYVGAEPPAGFDIKGNERSKKYHTPGSGGYDRTIADVWFATEEAAEAAGFSKAQR